MSEYVMPDEEIQSLMGAVSVLGIDAVYKATKAHSILMIDEKSDIDDMLMNMSDFLLSRARNTDDIELKNKYYAVSYMIKKLAHEMYRIYIRKNKKEENSRFLRLCK